MLPISLKKDGPTFNSVPEIIKDKGASGSAATSDTAPSETLQKKPLKSALKRPRTPLPAAITEPEKTTDASTEKDARSV